MRFRLHAQWEFRSQQGRNLWLSEYATWKTSAGVLLLELNTLIDEREEEPHEPVIWYRQDVGADLQAQTMGLFNLIQNRIQGGVFHVFASLHQCAFDGVVGSERAWQYFEFGVRPREAP